MSDDERDDSDVDDPGGPPPRVALSVDLLPTYVRGSPAHAAVTLRGDPPGAVLRLLPWPTLYSTAGAIGFVLRDAVSERVVAERRPRPVIAMDPGSPGLVLRAGAAYRTLVDLAPLLPRDLPMGAYRLSVRYASAFGEAAGAPVPVVLREPTAEERRTLDDLAAELPRGASWSAWIGAKAIDPEGLRGPLSKTDPLVYLRVMRWLGQGEDDLADIDPSSLDALTGIYAPEADVLRAELARARGDGGAVESIAARVLEAHPGLALWMEAVREGDSELQRENEARRERKRRSA